MTTKYFALLTSQGAAKLANMAALGTKLQITEMAVGDGGGTLPTPNSTQTKLVGEWRRAAINALSVDAVNSSQIIAEQVIPESEGGFWIREIGLYDADGDLIAVANCPETYKPKLAEGSGRTQTVRMILIVNSTSAITLKIDPSVVLATRKYADDKAAEAKAYTDSKVIEVKAYADDKMVKHLTAADPHTQYAPKASPVLTGTPKAPTAKAGDNSTQLATTGFVAEAIAAQASSAPEGLNSLEKLASALGNDPQFSVTLSGLLAGKLDTSKVGYALIDFGTVSKSGRTVRSNPFGNSTPVILRSEIQLNGKWAYPGVVYSSGGYGTEATYVEGEGIVVQCGSLSVTPTDASHGGSGIPGPGSILSSAPCRVHVWKLQP